MSKHFSKIKKAVKELTPKIVSINKSIFKKPELGFCEFHASSLLADALREEGFKVKFGKGKLKTAFEAGFNAGRQGGGSEPTVVILAEYDALPEIGHACGHNMIAAAAFGAAAAVKCVLEKNCGRLKVIGTPAEEGGGGKILMIKGGWFKKIDAAIMVHPAPVTRVVGRMLAVQSLDFHFYGKASHAAAHPDLGINALDAVIALFNSVNAMRQQAPDFSRVHGIVTHGGDAPNIIPEYASAKFYVRGVTMPDFRVMLGKITDCARGAAKSTGCRLKIEKSKVVFHPLEPNRAMGRVYARHMRAAGLKDGGLGETQNMGSSDIGNLSQIVPTLHPEFAVGNGSAVNHSRDFLKVVVSRQGEANMLKAATAMAATVADLLTDAGQMKKVKEEFAAFQKRNK